MLSKALKDGIPVVIPEAMALSNVIVSSDHFCMNVALEDGIYGRFFHVGDSVELKHILTELISVEDLLSELSEKSK